RAGRAAGRAGGLQRAVRPDRQTHPHAPDRQPTGYGMKELYFEDFHVGDRFRSSEYTMTESEMIEFARRFDPQPFHIDPEAAKRSVFGGLIASGWHTAAIAMRLRTQSEIRVAGGMIGMGVDELRWPRPVRSGDTIHLETEVIETRPSR